MNYNFKYFSEITQNCDRFVVADVDFIPKFKYRTNFNFIPYFWKGTSAQK